MLGFVAAAGAEFSSHETVARQFSDAPAAIVAVAVLFTAASLVPILRGTKREAFGPLTPESELWNGRVAMLGLAFMIVLELNTSKPIF